MSTAKPGDVVSISYEGVLDNGEIFESTNDTGPLEFTIGLSQVMPEFEKNIIGMSEGDEKEFTLAPEASYGHHNPELIHTIKRQGLKNQESMEVGMVLSLDIEREGQAHQVPAMIIALEKESVQVDFNHPLAGKSLTYKVTLKAITNA